MKATMFVTVILSITMGPSQAAAGELWSAFDEDRVDLCPAEGEFPADQASEYIAYNVHELGKALETLAEDRERHDQNSDRWGQPVPLFDRERQTMLRSVIDSAQFFSLNILAPVERVERADGVATDVRSIRVPPPTGTGSKERLRIGFARMLASAEDENGAILFDYNDALREMDAWTPVHDNIDGKSFHSYPLLLARDRLAAAHRALHSVMLEAIEQPSFAPNLERFVWAACHDDIEK
ncbi:hypothetical protein K5P26_02500 [Sphingopyxis sp. XHP0097]|uniref:Uncharacterized protein n=1 Tax=Sphingopyxis jiangsuensis TaxID=2871171 RepID=A0ABS7MAL4_9SPHN|nr:MULTISPECIES: hypothetical protein [Sphingopyxis]MBY4636009.1 hypothetical protein [Sphingopyxis jiangsuensis]